MPAPRKSQKPAQPEAADAVSAEATSVASGEAADAEAETDPVPLNRAERRAKGKKPGQVQQFGTGKAVRGTGPAGGPRLWANRRSG